MIYLIHFHQPLAHARHYIGFVDGGADQVQARLQEHRAGWGARILAECNRRGIHYDVVATFPGDRSQERRLKRHKKTVCYCPVCSPTRHQLPFRGRGAGQKNAP